MVLFPTSVLTLLPGLHSFHCYVGNLLVHMVLFPTSVLTLLPGLHSFHCYDSNLLVHMVLYLTSVLTLLPGLHSFHCFDGVSPSDGGFVIGPCGTDESSRIPVEFARAGD